MRSIPVNAAAQFKWRAPVRKPALLRHRSRIAAVSPLTGFRSAFIPSDDSHAPRATANVFLATVSPSTQRPLKALYF